MSTLGYVTAGVALLTLVCNVSFWLLAARGYRVWRKSRRAVRDPARWPRVHVFVCLKGDLPRLAETAAALDAQDYPGEYRVTFVTEGSAGDDTAAAQLVPVLARTSRSDHVVAGRVIDSSLRCSQKNFNLLRGIRHANERSKAIDAFAFCDGDLLVQRTWLKEMVRPIGLGTCEASTSFHYTTSDDRALIGALHGLAETCQSLASVVCQGFTWGGSMAIGASVFRRIRLASIWSRTVVDDITMSRVIRDSRLRVTPVAQFLVSGQSEIGSYGAFVRWLGRQYFFVKIYVPSYYRRLWVMMMSNVAAIWLAAYHATVRVVEGSWPVASWLGWTIVVTAFSLIAAFHLYRYLIPDRPSARAWLGASLLVPGASLLACADASLRRKRLTWSDKTYVLSRGGQVLRIDPSDDSPTPAPVPEKAVA